MPTNPEQIDDEGEHLLMQRSYAPTEFSDGVTNGQCPFCGYDSYQRETSELEDSECTVYCTCDKCGEHFKEFFILWQQEWRIPKPEIQQAIEQAMENTDANQ